MPMDLLLTFKSCTFVLIIKQYSSLEQQRDIAYWSKYKNELLKSQHGWCRKVFEQVRHNKRVTQLYFMNIFEFQCLLSQNESSREIQKQYQAPRSKGPSIPVQPRTYACDAMNWHHIHYILVLASIHQNGPNPLIHNVYHMFFFPLDA